MGPMSYRMIEALDGMSEDCLTGFRAIESTCMDEPSDLQKDARQAQKTIGSNNNWNGSIRRVESCTEELPNVMGMCLSDIAMDLDAFIGDHGHGPAMDDMQKS